MSDYTPGRWAVSPDFPLCVCESDGRKVDPVAYAVPYRPADFKLAEVEANARLMAAAPELLEACKAALEYLREDLEDNDPDARDEAGAQELARLGGYLQAAIVKAGGVV